MIEIFIPVIAWHFKGRGSKFTTKLFFFFNIWADELIRMILE